MHDIVKTPRNEIKTKVFISYSRKDIAFADELEAALRARCFEVLIDREEIYAFEDWWKRIEALIGGADTVVFVLSPDAVKSDVALKEVAYAASLNKRFAPIVCHPVEDGTVPEPLRRLNFIFFDDPERFEASADKLTEALQTDIVWIRRHTEFAETAHRWVEVGRPDGMLLRPPILDQAEAWLVLRPSEAPAPTAETEAFIAASRRAEVRARRRSRIVNFTLYAMFILMILGLLGWINQITIADTWRYVTVTWPYAWANVRPYVLSTVKERALKPGESFKECAQHCPEMVVIPAGTFAMGSSPTDKGAFGNEFPQHTVTIARPFAVSKYELTYADWDACVAGGGCNGYRPVENGWGRGRQPVTNVNWDDAQAYVAWLSRVTGKTYRLLSEAEYEYAMRGGTTTVFPWGDDIHLNGEAMANCDGCGSKWDNRRTAPVGSFWPNEFELFDMVGNVSAWIEDCLHDNYDGAPADGSAWLGDKNGHCDVRIVRGGSWQDSPVLLRSAIRPYIAPGGRGNKVGIRVARTLLAP